MHEPTKTKDSLEALISRLQDDLRVCDDLGHAAAAIDINQAIEKLKGKLPKAS